MEHLYYSEVLDQLYVLGGNSFGVYAQYGKKRKRTFKSLNDINKYGTKFRLVYLGVL